MSATCGKCGSTNTASSVPKEIKVFCLDCLECEIINTVIQHTKESTLYAQKLFNCLGKKNRVSTLKVIDETGPIQPRGISTLPRETFYVAMREMIECGIVRKIALKRKKEVFYETTDLGKCILKFVGELNSLCINHEE